MDPLDDLPLELLIALRDALADPSTAGRARAMKRAAEAGYHLVLGGDAPDLERASPPRYDPEPIPMEEAPEGVQSLRLRFDRPRG
jgi:hypothetical protein